MDKSSIAYKTRHQGNTLCGNNKNKKINAGTIPVSIPTCFDGKIDMMYFCQQFNKQNYIIRIISRSVICFTGNIDVWLSPLALVPFILNEK
ncbi:hypothetical protein [Parabacteroides distasonis]|uniref:hypothetical protein n=1 Tax=Parabacteroides distasonis TaxID=823 RepID=UPI003218F80A